MADKKKKMSKGGVVELAEKDLDEVRGGSIQKSLSSGDRRMDGSSKDPTYMTIKTDAER